MLTTTDLIPELFRDPLVLGSNTREDGKKQVALCTRVKYWYILPDVIMNSTVCESEVAALRDLWGMMQEMERKNKMKGTLEAVSEESGAVCGEGEVGK